MEQVEVTDSDREALAATVEDMGLLSGLTASHIRQGLYDNDCRFIAKARVEATQAKDEEIARLVEALETLVGETLVGDLSREDEKAVTPRGSYSTWISWSDRWAARDLIAKHKGRSNG